MWLISKHGASNVIARAERLGFVVEDTNKDPPNWQWIRLVVEPPKQNNIPSMNRAIEQLNRTIGQFGEAIGRVGEPPSSPRVLQPSDPRYHELTFAAHSKGMDTARGQRCGCDVCSEYTKMQEKVEPSGSAAPSRWSLLEID